MHPAKSVIAFTTMSGAGYGLLTLAILGDLLGLYHASPMLVMLCHGIAFVLISTGLLSSLLHLGRPERAWRAMSQWRTSWLSREGVASLATYGPWALFIYCRFVTPDGGNALLLSGIATMALAVTTIFTTSMIYRSLKAIPSWYNGYVMPVYLSFGLATGAAILSFLLTVAGEASALVNQLALGLVIVSILLKMKYWRIIDGTPSESTIESATGLGHLGKVTAHDAPHSHDNYLLQEMGFRIARKHSQKIRRIYSITWMIAALSLGLMLVLDSSTIDSALSALMLPAVMIGLVCERWLFFAEAKHVQALYYGH